MKKIVCLFALVAFTLVLGKINAREVTIGTLSMELPDSLRQIDVENRVYSASDGENLIMTISSINLNGKDLGKIRQKGDTLTYPFLKEATLIKTESEPWHDWTQDYVKHSYTYQENGKEYSAYTYHINANGNAYILLMLPYTEKGESMVEDITSKGLRSKGWYQAAAPWWWFLWIVVFIAMLFYAPEEGGYQFGKHMKMLIIALVGFAVVGLITTRGDMNYFWPPFLIAVAITVLTPPLRTPILWILEHVDGD